MKDALLEFGTITPATKATLAVSANKVNFGRTSKPGEVYGCKACFRINSDLASGDSVQMEVLDCATENGTYGVVAVSPVISGAKAGDIIEVPMPVDLKQFCEAGCMPSSTGTFTSITVTAWIEFR